MAGEALAGELGSLNFRDMIGGPLVAVVEAQHQSAMASIAFIRDVGFTTDDKGNITGTRDVTFKYKNRAPGSGADVDAELTVPLLTLTNPPSLRIERVTIDFNAKLTSVEQKRTTSDLQVGAELSAKGGFGPFSAELKASFAYQKKTEEGSEVNRSYSLSVHVEAVQDELPAGLDRVLNILESSIQSKAN
jgi:hypothetical protein